MFFHCPFYACIYGIRKSNISKSDRMHTDMHLNTHYPRLFSCEILQYNKLDILYPWASYQIRKRTGCTCDRNADNVFPATKG